MCKLKSAAAVAVLCDAEGIADAVLRAKDNVTKRSSSSSGLRKSPGDCKAGGELSALCNAEGLTLDMGQYAGAFALSGLAW